ncbi:MAG: efflux RND transporter periplasmic adaptor subunit, partial [Gammaproteobacteria bacterium]|nr:efflux RND transporter periplasmic adaptor subunit [Gammaproteobacteria bacterium]
MLSDQAYEDVLEARARLSVAEERYELALDRLNGFFIGEESLTLQSFAAVVMQAEAGVAQAEANVALAEAAVTQAEAVVNEAQAALNVFDAQIAKLTVHASVSGVLMVRNVEPGEILTPGMAALTIARLDDLTITVYIPEDQYGNIHLGDNVKVTADSFPGQTFSA